MAKGNDGNYLQHCVEVEAAARLARTGPEGGLHVALTHGMAPFEELEEPKSGVRKELLYGALAEAAGEPKCNDREIVKAYRKCRASRRRYPNTGELLRAVVGTDRLSGGITEVDRARHGRLAKAWRDTGIRVANSSWREELGRDGVLGCPSGLESPWLLSMDPMTFSEGGGRAENLNESDLNLLERALGLYFGSGQPGIACFFVYRMPGTKLNDSRLRFWDFVEDLAKNLNVRLGCFWLPHIGGNGNLAGLLFSDHRLASGFSPPDVNSGRGTPTARPGGKETLSNIPDVEGASKKFRSTPP